MRVFHGAVFVGLGLSFGFLLRPVSAVRARHEESVARRADHESVGQPLLEPTFAHHDAPALPTAQPAPELERARGIVDDATARGVWTQADREALREQLSTMTGDDQADVVARLASAINRGTVRVTADVPL